MGEQKWIKIKKNILNDPLYFYLKYKGKEYELIYLKFIITCNQVENENYGYIRTRIGRINIDKRTLGRMYDVSEEAIEDALDVLTEAGLIEIQDGRIKVIFPWDSDPTRNSPMYSEWKTKCLKRDNYQCQDCGSTNDIEVHHEVPWRICKDNDDIRYSIDNGITLCRKCHLKRHNGCWRD